MDELYRNKVDELRQRVPIGLKQGLTFLEQTNGNIEEAENLFKAHHAKIITRAPLETMILQYVSNFFYYVV
jgi:translation elongation factor EF-Ts